MSNTSTPPSWGQKSKAYWVIGLIRDFLVVMAMFFVVFLVLNIRDSVNDLRTQTLDRFTAPVEIMGAEIVNGQYRYEPLEACLLPGESVSWESKLRTVRTAEMERIRYLYRASGGFAIDRHVQPIPIAPRDEPNPLTITARLPELEPGDYYLLNSYSVDSSNQARYYIYFSVSETC